MRSFLRFIIHKLSDGIENSTTGMFIMVVCMSLILYLTLREGGTSIVSDLITMAIIVAASLMGVNSIAEIFKKSPPKFRDEPPPSEDQDDVDP